MKISREDLFQFQGMKAGKVGRKEHIEWLRVIFWFIVVNNLNSPWFFYTMGS
jgi:hypothetical protein